MTREEVVSALRIEVKDFYENNGNELGDDSVILDITTIENALALLEAQEPQVMTLHEIDDVINIASEEYKRIFWAEVRSKTRKSFGVFQLDIASEDLHRMEIFYKKLVLFMQVNG